MPICVGIGEAAGVAAMLATREGVTLKEVTAEQIREVIFGV